MALRPAYARRSDSHGMPRRRSLLAGLLAAGIAMAGLAFTGSPASAEETAAASGESTLEIAITDCETYGGDGNLHYAVHDPYTYYRDFITVRDAAGTVVHEATYLDDPVFEATDFETDVPLPPGDYIIVYSAERETGGRRIDEQNFTIGACPDLNVDLVDPTCSTGDDGLITLVLSGLVVGEAYHWTAGGFSGSFVAESDTLEIPLSSGSPPGNYLAYAETVDDSPVYDWRAFAIEPCQPGLTVTVTQCTVAGGTGTVDVALANLVHGVVYTVTGPDGSIRQATAQPSGVTTLSFPSIPGGTHSTVTVAGTWTVDQPYEEPPYIGGGDFVPLDTVALTASADVTLDPCPAAVVPASSGGTTGLPATGTDPVVPIGAALLLLGLGTAVLAISRRRTAVRAPR